MVADINPTLDQRFGSTSDMPEDIAQQSAQLGIIQRQVTKQLCYTSGGRNSDKMVAVASEW